MTESSLENISLRYVTFRLKNGEIRQNYYYFADLQDGVQVRMECDEGKLQWMEADDLPFNEMPHTASYVMKHYEEIGKHNDVLYTGASAVGDVLFCELVEF